MPTDPVRLYDYTYQQWRDLAERNTDNWTQEQMDLSWDQHIQFPVWVEPEIKPI